MDRDTFHLICCSKLLPIWHWTWPFSFTNLIPRKSSLPLLTKKIILICRVFFDQMFNVFWTWKRMFLTLKNKLPALVRVSSWKWFSPPHKGRKLSQRRNPILDLGNFILLGSRERTGLFRKSLHILGNLFSHISVSFFGSTGWFYIREMK